MFKINSVKNLQCCNHTVKILTIILNNWYKFISWEIFVLYEMKKLKFHSDRKKREIYAQNVRLTYFPIIEVLWGNNSQSKLNFTQVTPVIDNFFLLQFYHMHKTFKRDHTASLIYHLKLVGWMIVWNSFFSFDLCCYFSLTL